jgi:methyl-CpG-binding domain protein 4
MRLPNSPYLLLQEIYHEHPWRMLVCCIFLNCTSRKQVDRVRDRFFELYPSPKEAVAADPEEMASILAPLGFRNRRTQTLIRFSTSWLTPGWSEPKELYGIGKYGQDSWEIFQKDNLEVESTDGVLNKYLDWARTQARTQIQD